MKKTIFALAAFALALAATAALETVDLDTAGRRAPGPARAVAIRAYTSNESATKVELARVSQHVQTYYYGTDVRTNVVTSVSNVVSVTTYTNDLFRGFGRVFRRDWSADIPKWLGEGGYSIVYTNNTWRFGDYTSLQSLSTNLLHVTYASGAVTNSVDFTRAVTPHTVTNTVPRTVVETNVTSTAVWRDRLVYATNTIAQVSLSSGRGEALIASAPSNYVGSADTLLPIWTGAPGTNNVLRVWLER